MVDLWLKLQMEIGNNRNTRTGCDFFFACLPSLHIFISIWSTLMYPSEEAHPGASQASKINLFGRIVSVIKLTLLFLPKATSWVFEGL